jgi:hypothetical protein
MEPPAPGFRKCPDCAEEIRAEARKCRFCGLEFPPEETQPVKELQEPERPEPKNHWMGLIALVVLISVLILGAYLKSGDNATSSDTSSVGSSAVPSTTTAHTGDVVMVKPGYWPCGSSKEALDEMIKWALLKDNEEMFRVMRRTDSFALTPDGFQLKVLDRSFTMAKVRVLGWLDPDDGKIHAYPEENRIGKECWVVTEAVDR